MMAVMIPMKHSSIFRSRWFALLWAAGILWFAYDVAGGGDQTTDANGVTTVTDATGAPVSDQQVKDLEKAIEGL
jgi:hypothetical protein